MTKKRVLLYNPPSDFYAMPLGLLAVGSAVHARGAEVRIFDSRIDERAEERLLDDAERASCVGLTVFSGPPIEAALRLSRRIKALRPGLPVVWGGWHSSILPEQCVRSGVVDAVVIGQGEGTFSDLVEVIDDPSQWSSIPGLCIPGRDGSPVRTAPRALTDMNQFPASRYELLDVESYFRRKGVRQIDYSSSRGCPYRCTFCADPIIYKSKWTGLKAGRTLTELMHLHEKYAIDEVFFLDDDLFASLKRIQALAEAFVEARAPFGWKGTARADELCRLPEAFFERLRVSGCRRINIGAESGSQQVLDRIKKEYRAGEIVTAGRRAANAGIGVAYSFITGFPGETGDDFQATLEMIKELRGISDELEATLFFYSPYPGTELMAELEARGSRLPERLEDWAGFSIESVWLPDRKRLSRKVRDLNFYLRHGYAARGGGPVRRGLQAVSRFRCDRDWYRVPLEPYLASLFR